MRVAVLGGTGKLGLGLVWRLGQAGHKVTIGSRHPGKAQDAARSISVRVDGMSNTDAAEACEIAILSVPYGGHRQLVEAVRLPLGGKIVIDSTVPLDPANPLRLRTHSGNSAAEEARALLGEDSAVFAAFHTISYHLLRQPNVSSDVLIAGDSTRKEEVLQLIRGMNLDPVYAGPLELARILEEMTVLLISINKQYKVKQSGLKILGIS